MKKIICYFLFVIVTGCASNRPVRITEDNSITIDKIPSIYFVADNQFHIVDGKQYPLQNYVSDKFTGVAIRPPQTTIFGPPSFETFLSGLDQSPLLLHLGDAADISCPQELDRFFQTMHSYEGPWVFTPGNHDCFYTGNSQHKSSYTETWDEACGGKRLDKADTIISYLANRFNKEILRSDFGEKKVEGKWNQNGYNGRYFANIVHNGDSTQRSFLVQEVCFKPANGNQIRIILLDTAQYKKPPKYRNLLWFFGHKVAGITGEILDDQMKVVENWLMETADAEETIFFAGHHPLKTNFYSKSGLAWWSGSKWLKKTINDTGAAGYISAHTHIGGKRKFEENKFEWNISSFVDWPLGISVMEIKEGVPKIKEVLFDREKTVPGVDSYCSENIGWKSKEKDFSFYTKYRDEKLTGPTGRYMQHYLLIAELEIIVNALKKLDPSKFQEFISTKEQLIKKAKSRFKNRVPVKSEAEIKHLRPHVTEAVKVLNDFFQLATGDQKKMIDKYCWCQLWWAAKEDAQRQWNEPDVTGMRDEW